MASWRLARAALEAVQFVFICLLYAMAWILPAWFIYPATRTVGNLVFCLLPVRRRIAIENVRHALGSAAEPTRARAIARASFGSFLLTAMPETAKVRHRLASPRAAAKLLRRSPDLTAMFEQARRLHERSRGCIFVTPHFGNWELLPDTAAAIGIPVAVVIRPLENRYLEHLLQRSRATTGQIFVAKRNAFLALQRFLGAGRSVALLPDQATFKGLAVEFMGRPALTTPVPALLAVYQQRPIVVVACFRTGALRFSGFVSEPIWPGHYESERAEVERLTAAMNRVMEEVVRRHPEQYLWMHNRWKAYKP
ncbi:MAG: lysophospholipid acyltransferase family protein [Thermoanaerobaculales bacterium]